MLRTSGMVYGGESNGTYSVPFIRGTGTVVVQPISVDIFGKLQISKLMSMRRVVSRNNTFA
jgi:uncharacterized protein (AIM24 family)